MVNPVTFLWLGRIWLAVLVLIAAFVGPWRASAAAGLGDITLPPGFRIDIFANGLPGARSLALGPRGTVFVGSRNLGEVRAVLDHDADGWADDVVVIARGLATPNGVAVRGDALYVGESGRILRFDRIEARLRDKPVPAVVRDDLPAYAHHGWRYIGFGPDDRLYVSMGAPCNVCDEPAPYARIISMAPDGSDLRVFASGVRNSVGFAWHPVTGDLWFTDNGRDHLGDDLPPDELNHAPDEGLHFGFPYCHGGVIPDPEFGHLAPCADFRPPAARLGPHVAALGMRFYTGQMFPDEYHGQIFIAEHGSWNRSEKIGYRISLVRLDGDRVTSYSPFAEGWLKDGQVSGRPVDLLVMPDGAMLVSDDRAGVIYRITHEK